MDEILLCTHDPLLVKNLYGVLRDKGHGVDLADHTALAVQMILDHSYSAVIIDAQQVGLLVDEAVKIIGAVAPELPIIVVGGNGHATDALSMQVPADLEQLRELISGMNQRSRISHNQGGN